MMQTQLPLPKFDALPGGAHQLFMLTDDALFQSIGVRIGFTGRAGGVSESPFEFLNCGSHVHDDPANVSANRVRVLEALGGSDAYLVVPNQVHGTDILEINSQEDISIRKNSFCPSPNDEHSLADNTPRSNSNTLTASTDMSSDVVFGDCGLDVDGIIVRTKNVCALLNFADCLPLIIVAPTGSFAVLHCGWRGALALIASKSLQELCEKEQVNPASCNAYIGPHICSDCFEVGIEVAEQFSNAFDSSVATRDACQSEDKAKVNLARAVSFDLIRAGIDPQRIIDCHMCTKENLETVYSYRASNGVCGRHSACALRLDV